MPTMPADFVITLHLGAAPALTWRRNDSTTEHTEQTHTVEHWSALQATQRSSVPRASDIELLIEHIENWLMPVLRERPDAGQPATSLHCDAAFLAQLNVQLADHPPAIADIEARFNELADIANGRPASHSRQPLDAGFVARFVLLREVMHHGGFVTAVPVDTGA